MEGQNKLIFVCPSASQALVDLGFIDKFWLYVNSILVGLFKPLFQYIAKTINLSLLESKSFRSKAIALSEAIIYFTLSLTNIKS